MKSVAVLIDEVQWVGRPPIRLVDGRCSACGHFEHVAEIDCSNGGYLGIFLCADCVRDLAVILERFCT